MARRYLDGELEFARAVAELEERALVPHAEALVKYINRVPQLRHDLHRRAAPTSRRGSPRAPARRPTDETRWRCFKTETHRRRVEARDIS